ncbi:MAG: TetR/AcrR family transcriptional regulator, partial [Eubacterium sp.]
NKSYNETDLEVIGLAEFGARKELFIDYYEREIALTKDQMNYYFIKALFRLMDLDGDMIKNTIQQAFEFLKDKKPEQIKFLV